MLCVAHVQPEEGPVLIINHFTQDVMIKLRMWLVREPQIVIPGSSSGKLVSPKWKNFKGLKLQWRDKIRLNNAIWRAWYMQYLEKRKNPVCHFVTPLDGSVEVDEHRRPEAITTEGKYWKSRIEIVIREYHKWRTYFKKRLQQHKDEDLSSLAQDDDMLYWHKHRDGWKTPVPMEEDTLLDTDMLMSEFADTLFSTLSSHPPVAWPNPREIAHLGNADMIQPGLIPLQPNLDFMDTFEPFQAEGADDTAASWQFPAVRTGPRAPAIVRTDLFSSSRSIFGPVPPTPASAPAADPNSPPAQGAIPDAQRTTLDFVEAILPTPALPSPGDPFIQPTDLGPSAPPLSVPQPYLPVFTPQKFAGVSKPPSVITHTASATLTHDASATTFSQSPGLIITTRYPAPSTSPCGLALSPVTRPPTVGPPQPRLTFVHPKPVSLPVGRPKQPPKIVPAPKPEPLPVVLKNACIAPAPFPGQPQAVIMTSGPLKREGILASTGSQSNVVITPAAIARAPGVTEFHSGILVTDLGHGSGSQPAPVSRLFSPSAVQDSLVKGEQVPLHGGVPQVPAAASTEQKRRFNIKMGFDTLNSLISNNTKLTSHAITLQKTVEYITKLQQERSQMQEEARRLREEIEELNATIIAVQFSVIIKPLFESFKGVVSTSSLEELHRTALSWLDEHCSLPILRPTVLSSLRHLSTTTSVLTDPSQLPRQAAEAVARTGKSTKSCQVFSIPFGIIAQVQAAILSQVHVTASSIPSLSVASYGQHELEEATVQPPDSSTQTFKGFPAEGQSTLPCFAILSYYLAFPTSFLLFSVP
ncbi:MLX-interacting protein [Camelus ferus]|nr:MLX-interacting protein [Camelus ferus]